MPEKYTKVYDWIMQRGGQDGLTITARLVYCLIYGYKELGKPCYITEAGTARRLGVGRMTIYRAIRELLEKGWVVRSIPEDKKRYFYQCKLYQNDTLDKVYQNDTPTVSKRYTKVYQNDTPYIKDIENNIGKEKSEESDLEDRNLLLALRERHQTDYSFLLDPEYRSQIQKKYSHIENFDIDAVTEDIIKQITEAKPGGPRWKVKNPYTAASNQYWLAAESCKVQTA